MHIQQQPSNSLRSFPPGKIREDAASNRGASARRQASPCASIFSLGRSAVQTHSVRCVGAVRADCLWTEQGEAPASAPPQHPSEGRVTWTSHLLLVTAGRRRL